MLFTVEQVEVGLAKVSKLLGHSSVTTTEIYAHLAPNEVSEEATTVLNPDFPLGPL